MDSEFLVKNLYLAIKRNKKKCSFDKKNKKNVHYILFNQ